MSSARAGYAVLVPVKPPAVAKSRLAPLGDLARRALVTAFALDTITAAVEAPTVEVVLAVTDDHDLARGLRALGAEVIPDGAADLNGSLVQAAAEVARRWPGLAVAALCADLPALRAAELDRALGAATGHRLAFVPDAARTGTTMVAAPSPSAFTPRFGPDSRRRHLALGAVEVSRDDIPTLRRDVDTPADLAAALGLGVGVRTSSVAEGLRL